MEHNNSLFEQAVRQLDIPTCSIFISDKKLRPVSFVKTESLITDSKIMSAYPRLSSIVLDAMPLASKQSKNLRIAALFSGGPAAGGHNVLLGLSRLLTKYGHTLLGVRNGPGGLLKGEVFKIKPKDIGKLANSGGFDYLGTDRTKINTMEQLNVVNAVCKKNEIDAIIIIGGDDSNTNAAFMAEHLQNIQVIGVPKTMDGDVQVQSLLPVPFGYDTACRIYAELVGNILQDTPSSRKYWHFVKLMGRTASQVVLEVSLQTQPHITIISEEVLEKKYTLNKIVDQIADMIIDRAKNNMPYGVVLVPEGLLEFIFDVQELIDEINAVLSREKEQIRNMKRIDRIAYFGLHVTHHELFAKLPQYIQDMIVKDRDAHGNLEVSQIETEKLLAEMVDARVQESGSKCSTQIHSFGYEGKCGAPTPFDAMLGYNLGLCAGSLVLDGRTGYMAAFTDFTKDGRAIGLPLKGLLHIENRDGKEAYVIQKALVKLNSPAFIQLDSMRKQYAQKDLFCSPEPRQYWGPTSKQLPLTVFYNQQYTSREFNI